MMNCGESVLDESRLNLSSTEMKQAWISPNRSCISGSSLLVLQRIHIALKFLIKH